MNPLPPKKTDKPQIYWKGSNETLVPFSYIFKTATITAKYLRIKRKLKMLSYNIDNNKIDLHG